MRHFPKNSHCYAIFSNHKFIFNVRKREKKEKEKEVEEKEVYDVDSSSDSCIGAIFKWLPLRLAC